MNQSKDSYGARQIMRRSFFSLFVFTVVTLSTGCVGPLEELDCYDNDQCSDGKFCNGQELCLDGVCQAGKAPDCADDIECTDDSCHEDSAGCRHVPNHAKCTSDELCHTRQGCTLQACSLDVECDDFVFCNGAEICSEGVCKSGSSIDCADGIDCTADSCTESEQGAICINAPADEFCAQGQICDLQAGCQEPPCSQDDDCLDADPCTVDSCGADGNCSNLHQENPGSEGPAGNASCSNGIDDDCDGLSDAADPNCIDCTEAADCDDQNQCSQDDCVAGVCVNTPLAEGSACSDGDQCTRRDACQSGLCEGTDPVVCPAADDCHHDGACDTQSGQCAYPAMDDNAICTSDGVDCTDDFCRAGVCTHLVNDDFCSGDRVCDLTADCVVPPCQNALDCDDQDSCTLDECQADGACSNTMTPKPDMEGPAGHANCANLEDDDCDGLVDEADPDCVECDGPEDCDDHNPCTADECTNRACSNPALSEGSCDDGDLCTTTDRCLQGVCVGTAPVQCTAQDDCHEVGSCDPKTGLCSNPPKNTGSCNDADACTRLDTCLQGICVGSDPVQCQAQDECHLAGVCNQATGQCSNPAQVDNEACPADSIACTRDVCMDGVCKHLPDDNRCADDLICDANQDCIEAPCQIDPDCNDWDPCTTDICLGTGACQNTLTPTNQAEGAPGEPSCQNLADDDCDGYIDLDDADCIDCTDDKECYNGNPCTVDTCELGVCVENAGAANGQTCDDGDRCTQDEQCNAGICSGRPVSCATPAECYQTGLCDSVVGCTYAPDNGATCTDDRISCTADLCSDGSCQHDLLVDWCLIDGACYAATTRRDGYECQVCDPGQNPHAWTALSGISCGSVTEPCVRENICSAGTCQPIFHSNDHVCDPSVAEEFNCLEGTGCGTGLYLNTQVRMCSGVGAACDGSLIWNKPELFDRCEDYEKCSTNGCVDARLDERWWACNEGELYDSEFDQSWTHNLSKERVSWELAYEICARHGRTWSLPNISQLRTLAEGCKQLDPRGRCMVIAGACEEIDCLDKGGVDSCTCFGADPVSGDGCFWSPLWEESCEYFDFWSATETIDPYSKIPKMWGIAFHYKVAGVFSDLIDSAHYPRCVRPGK